MNESKTAAKLTAEQFQEYNLLAKLGADTEIATLQLRHAEATFAANRQMEHLGVRAVASPTMSVALASQVAKQCGEYVRQATSGAQTKVTVQ